MPDNDWNEWSNHVLFELERLNECYKDLDNKIDEMKTNITLLNIKSGIWGMAGAAIPTIGAILFVLLRGL